MLKSVLSAIMPTFCDLAHMFWTHILNKSERISAVYVVFDRYLENSIKTQTREKIGDQSLLTANIQPHMKALDLKKLLASSKSKSQLTKFYTKYFCEQVHELLTDTQSIYTSAEVLMTRLCKSLMIAYDISISCTPIKKRQIYPNDASCLTRWKPECNPGGLGQPRYRCVSTAYTCTPFL